MTANARKLLGTGAALFALCVAPAAASAQQTLEPVRVTASASKADRLAAEADALANSVRKYGKASRLYEASAAERPFGDARAAAALRSAAYLRYYSGDREPSVNLMERAAEQSVASGDVVAAANAYIDAALVAHELKHEDRAYDLGHRGELLLNSPLLADAQRAALRSRISDGEKAVAFLQRP